MDVDSYRLLLPTGRILKELRRELVWTYCCLDYWSPLHMMLGQVQASVINLRYVATVTQPQRSSRDLK